MDAPLWDLHQAKTTVLHYNYNCVSNLCPTHVPLENEAIHHSGLSLEAGTCTPKWLPYWQGKLSISSVLLILDTLQYSDLQWFTFISAIMIYSISLALWEPKVLYTHKQRQRPVLGTGPLTKLVGWEMFIFSRCHVSILTKLNNMLWPRCANVLRCNIGTYI